MDMKKLGSMLLKNGMIIYAIVAVLLNLIIFSIYRPLELPGTDHALVFWFSYGFLMLAFLMQPLTMLIVRPKGGVNAVFLGYPMIVVSLFYFIVSLVLSLAFMTLVSFGVAVPFQLMLVLECILLGVYLIALILSKTNADIVGGVDENIRRSVFELRSLQVDVEALAEQVSDPALRKKLEKLAEDIRYSDPMTNESVAALDLQVKDAIAELEVFVAQQDYQKADGKILEATLLISKRNKRLAISK